MAIDYHVKSERRKRVQLRQQNASAIRAGRPALVITAKAKNSK